MKAKRILALVAAALLLLAGGAGTLLAWLQAQDGGYFATSEHHFSTSAGALKTDEIEVGMSSAHATDPNPDLGEVARVRIVVKAADPKVPLFVGIGPKDEVEAYLRGGSYDEFVSAELDPFRATFRRVAGTVGRAANPGAQPFWVASSAGTGPRTLKWNKTHGAWSVVVMRLNGEPGVDVRASIGLRFGFLLPVGIPLLVAGALVLALGIRGYRRTP